MRVVSLNLDHGDAAVVRRALRQVLDACQCSERPDRALCSECEALAATIEELDRLVRRPSLGRTPLMTIVAAAGRPHPAGTAHHGAVNGPAEFRLVAGDGGG